MNRTKAISILLYILQVILGILFVVSALSKLFSIEKLEFTLVENINMSWVLSIISARLLIGFELFLGLHLILFHKNNLNKKVSLITLIIFTLYLVVIYLLKGDEKDCGCFGEIIKLTTFQSIIKNIILLSLNG
jgi:heme A synthase